MLKHLTKVSDFSKEECEEVVSRAIELKRDRHSHRAALANRTLLMLFEKPSLRTRVSFETGMTQLGGHAIFYSVKDSPLGEKESLRDTAKTASRYVDLIAARLFSRRDTRELAENAEVPVINMLDDFGHPCQILCDLQTIREKKGEIEALKLAYFGDARNNVTYDLMRGAALFGMRMDVGCPEGADFSPEREVREEVSRLSKRSGAEIRVLHDAKKAAKGSHVVYTDSWMSYGIAAEKAAERKKALLPYQVNAALMREAEPGALFMNCLPAMRGWEQTAEVIDGPQSVVFDQAENRLHVQKAVILFLLGKL